MPANPAYIEDDDAPITLGAQPYGNAPDRCIYCGKPPDSDEHIIPYCLGANTYLPRASCKECRDTTSYLEGYIGRALYGPFRIYFGVQSRRKKIDLQTVPVEFETGDGTYRRSIAREELPVTLHLPLLAEPGILADRPRHADFVTTAVWTWTQDEPEKIIAKFLKPGDLKTKIPFEINLGPFCRSLAKIAHTFAIAHFGIDSFKPYLPNLILGRSTNISYYIGGDEPPTTPTALPGAYGERVVVTGGHRITCESGIINGRLILVARIRLFTFLGTPSYCVVVGKPRASILEALKSGVAAQWP